MDLYCASNAPGAVNFTVFLDEERKDGFFGVETFFMRVQHDLQWTYLYNSRRRNLRAASVTIPVCSKLDDNVRRYRWNSNYPIELTEQRKHGSRMHSNTAGETNLISHAMDRYFLFSEFGSITYLG
jgi:hypothetical protein